MLRAPPATQWLVALLLVAACGRSTPYRPAKVPGPPPPNPPLSCALELVDPRLDFGALGEGESKLLETTIRNRGQGPCEVGVSRLDSKTAPAFSLVEHDAQPTTLESGDEFPIKVLFAPGPAALPRQRLGEVVVPTSDPLRPSFVLELEGEVKLCELHASPSPLDFGNVTLNARASAHLTLSNPGKAACEVSRIAFGPGTDSNFSFAVAPTAATLVPGASVALELDFTAATSTAPNARAGSVIATSNDLAHPELVVPLAAFISTICTQAGQYIYTVDSNGMFSRFDPTTLTSLDIASLQCPTAASPFSMNVDQSAIAWIVFDDGALFRVDTATAACSATAYQPSQHGFTTFGMGSVFDSSSGLDTLYLASGAPSATTSQLGILAFPSLTVTPVATVHLGWIELTGTGDGQLWGYAPTGSTSGGPVLAQLNRTTGATLEHYNLPEIDTVGGFAVKFFGGAFFIFVGPDVWEVDRSALLPGHPSPTVPAKRVLRKPGRDIVGAGVSTCAPVQK